MKKFYVIVLIVGSLAIFSFNYYMQWMNASQRVNKFMFQPKRKLLEGPRVFVASQFALDQLNHYDQLTSQQHLTGNFSFNINDASNYTWTMTDTVDNKTYFVIVLNEYSQANQSSRGGSSFIVRAKSQDYLYVCPVRDLFNGTYYIYCQTVPDCVTITVELKYVNFSAFATVPVKWLDKRVMSLTTCFNLTSLQTSFYGWKKLRLSAESSPLLWHDNDSFGIRMTVTDISKCLTDKVNKLFIVGNSHMRITFQYLMNVLGLMTEKNFNPDDRYVNYTFEHKFWHSCLPYASAVASAIRWQNDNNWQFFNTFQTSNNSTVDVAQGQLDNRRLKVVIVSIGEQDVRDRGIIYFNRVGVPTLTSAITDMTRLLTADNRTRVIYVTQPPVGNRYHQQHTGLLRLATMGAASAAVINALSNNTNITIIDGYTIQLPRYEESVDGIHFTMPQYAGRNKKLGFNGDVGKAVIMKILEKFC